MVIGRGGPNGSIDPGAPVTVSHSAIVHFTVTPDADYAARVGGTSGGTLVGATCTTSPILADCTVEASFTAAFPAARVGAWRPSSRHFYPDTEAR